MNPPLASEAALPTPVEWARELISARVQPGDWAVDATAGNGHDTELLARLVQPAGRVYAFDVQASAIAATRARLEAASLLPMCTLIHDGHERMTAHLPEECRTRIKAVMFNLGWLPWHDKNCITRPETTLPALHTAVEWLRPGGVITIVTYPNHDGGDDEARAITDAVCGLSSKTFEARHLRSHYRLGRSPECWAIRKRP